jgi:serine protease AprX
VGIIDSEIHSEHDALKGRVVKAKNFTKEPWDTPDKHATAVAGIIGSNSADFLGMAPEAKLFNYKVLATDNNLNSDNFEGSMAIQKAVEDGMQIINCSWGDGPVESNISRLAKACNAAWELGIVVVKSAGNNGPGPGTLTRPAEADGIIVVGATGKDGRIVEDYSSRGPLPSGENRPHLVAPGGSFTFGITSCFEDRFDNVGAGTSYAAPHVTGLLALILEEHPQLSPDELRTFVIKLCNLLNGFGEEIQGAGLISLRALLA